MDENKNEVMVENEVEGSDIDVNLTQAPVPAPVVDDGGTSPVGIIVGLGIVTTLVGVAIVKRDDIIDWVEEKQIKKAEKWAKKRAKRAERKAAKQQAYDDEDFEEDEVLEEE